MMIEIANKSRVKEAIGELYRKLAYEEDY